MAEGRALPRTWRLGRPFLRYIVSNPKNGVKVKKFNENTEKASLQTTSAMRMAKFQRFTAEACSVIFFCGFSRLFLAMNLFFMRFKRFLGNMDVP